jgi:hypothetical protein
MPIKTTTFINDFSYGELNERLYGRIDTKPYYKGLKELTNMCVWSQGGVFKRGGTRYISTAGDYAHYVRLLPFIYSEEASYAIEVGEGYMRFYTDGGQILSSSGTVYEIATDFLGEETLDVKFAQNADVMYLTHPNHFPKKLTRYDHNDWTIDDVPIVNGAFRAENEDDIYLTPSAVTGIITISGTTDIFDPLHVGSIWKFRGTEKKTETLSGADQWSDILNVDSNESVVVSIEGSSWSATVTLQRSTDHGSTWLDVYYWTANVSTAVSESYDDIYYRIGIKIGDYTSGTPTVTIGKLDEYGYVLITDVVSATLASGTVEKTLPSATATKQWSEGAWSEYRGYPACVAFYGERLYFAATESDPQTIWGSQVDDYENFESGAADSDAISFNIASNSVNTIQWMLDFNNVLHVGTLGAEWKFGNGTDAITPTNPAGSYQTPYGSNSVQAIPVSEVVLFIQRGGTKLRQRMYSYNDDKYIAPEISIFSQHLLEDGICELHYADRPDPIVYMVDNAGDIVSLSFDTRQNLNAFSSIITSGIVESICIIPGVNEDELYAVVKRVNGNGTYRFIEHFETVNWTEQKDAWYVDSGLSYEGELTTVVSGLDHLEGWTVAVTTSGAVHGYYSGHVVTNGVISLEYPVGHLIVGLPYDAMLRTMDVNAVIDGGSTQLKKKTITKAYVDLMNTVGCSIGSTENTFTTIPFRSFGDNMNTPVTPFNGYKEVVFPHGFSRDLNIFVKSTQPTPLFVRSVLGDLIISDE